MSRVTKTAPCPINSSELGYAPIRVDGVNAQKIPEFCDWNEQGMWATPSGVSKAQVLCGNGTKLRGTVAVQGEQWKSVDGKRYDKVWTADVSGPPKDENSREELGALVYDGTGERIYGFLTTGVASGKAVIPAKVIFGDIDKRLALLCGQI